MGKTFFVAGYSGDIGTAIIKNLELIIKNSETINIIKISGRDNILEITKHIESNFDYNGENILINAIGTGVYGMSDELNLQDFEKAFEGNFYIPMRIFQTFAKINKEFSINETRKLSSLIFNINSKSALEPFPQGGAYNSSKAAISMFLKVLGKENAKYGLKVKEVYPGVIQTKMLDNMPYIPKNGVQSLDDFVNKFLEML